MDIYDDSLFCAKIINHHYIILQKTLVTTEIYRKGPFGLRIASVSESVTLAAPSQHFLDTLFKTMTACVS